MQRIALRTSMATAERSYNFGEEMEVDPAYAERLVTSGQAVYVTAEALPTGPSAAPAETAAVKPARRQKPAPARETR